MRCLRFALLALIAMAPVAWGTNLTFTDTTTSFSNVGGDSWESLTVSCVDTGATPTTNCSLDQIASSVAFGFGVTGASDGSHLSGVGTTVEEFQP